MDTFRLTVHPASEGDALQLSWGAGAALHHAFVDLGRTKDYRGLRELLARIGGLDLLVLSHIDADHIEGAVALFKEATPPVHANSVLFNAHLQHEQALQRSPPSSRVTLSPPQAEKVTAGLDRMRWPRNGPFSSGIVSIDSDEAQQALRLVGDLQVLLLSPSDAKLVDLLPTWNDALKEASARTVDPDEAEPAPAQGRVRLGGIDVEALANAPFKRDITRPNGASIAFIAEFQGRRILLAADAHAETLESSLRKLGASTEQRYRLDCLKVAHHGSKHNTSPALLGLIDCTRFAFSTDGTRHQHPDAETIARILVADPVRPKTLYFNFRQDQTSVWDNADLMLRWNYRCVYPDHGRAGIAFDI